jgi:DNA replication initiation complex subunit (GINS family)
LGGGKLDEEQKEFTISYETLFDLLKREKERADLQKLDENFFKYLVEFLKEKKQILTKPSLNSFEEKKNLERQLENIKKLLIDLYGKREKKITGLALDKSRTKSTIVDDSTLLKEEKQFFDTLVKLFDSYREGILFNILDGKLPFVEEKEENKKIETKENEEEIKKDTKLVRFIHAVPKFVGEELEEYGPFEEEDIANLPIKIADLLVTKGRAEEMKSN